MIEEQPRVWRRPQFEASQRKSKESISGDNLKQWEREEKARPLREEITVPLAQARPLRGSTSRSWPAAAARAGQATFPSEFA